MVVCIVAMVQCAQKVVEEKVVCVQVPVKWWTLVLYVQGSMHLRFPHCMSLAAVNWAVHRHHVPHVLLRPEVLCCQGDNFSNAPEVVLEERFVRNEDMERALSHMLSRQLHCHTAFRQRNRAPLV